MFFVYYKTKSIIWFTIILECVLIFTWGILCRRVIVLPLDILKGKKEEIYYFTRMCNVENYEFFRKKYYCEWHLRSSQKSITILVPVCLSEEDIFECEKPTVNQKIKIKYYSFSKILCSWEVL